MRTRPSELVRVSALAGSVIVLMLGIGGSLSSQSAQAPGAAAAPSAVPPAAPLRGTLQRVKVHGPSLDANLMGESASPEVSIYLPPSLKKYKAIALDVGLQDSLLASNRLMDEALTRFGVSHAFETYEGDHGNRVPQRLEEKVLPFFSNVLSFEPPKRDTRR